MILLHYKGYKIHVLYFVNIVWAYVGSGYLEDFLVGPFCWMLCHVSNNNKRLMLQYNWMKDTCQQFCIVRYKYKVGLAFCKFPFENNESQQFQIIFFLK